MKVSTCPICAKAPPSADYKPFCSRRCADLDLQRWFTGKYAIPVVEDVNAVIHHAEEEKTKLGTGGMISKLRAVQDAVNCGVECIIASGRNTEQLPALANGQGVGTLFPVKRS